MPKVGLGTEDYSGVDAAKGFSDYAGDVPPKGLYRTKVKLFRLVENSNGAPMFKIIFEINEPKGSKKAKYNGYAIWYNANTGTKSVPFTNAKLDALGISRKAVWVGKAIILSKENPEDVVKIGSVKVIGIEVAVNAKRREYKGEQQLNAVSFMPINEVDEDVDDDDDDDVDDEDESDDEDDDDDDDEDEDDASF